jgi:hypothetical protein
VAMKEPSIHEQTQVYDIWQELSIPRILSSKMIPKA